MHDIQRIFYFHLPSWIAMFCAFIVVFYANVALSASPRNAKWDALGVSAVEVGVMCCTIGLITGPLWARPVWGIWWTWDARLTTTFILWLLYVSYLLLRGLLEDPEKKATLSADFRHLRFSRCPAGVSLESFVAHPASPAGNRRRERFGTRSADGQGFVAVRGRGILRHGVGLHRSLPAGTFAQRVRRVEVSKSNRGTLRPPSLVTAATRRTDDEKFRVSINRLDGGLGRLFRL